jgi:UDP-arabinose 4-epimerase
MIMGARKVLVTGGAGYVGSHSCKAFAAAGWDVTVVDNLSRGHRQAVRWGPLIEADVTDETAMRDIVAEQKPDLVAHFAAYAYVGESVEQPDLYYRNNVGGTRSLLAAMAHAGAGRIVFSSTCATYGPPVRLPIDEDHPQSPINPYGWSKLFCERMLADYAAAYGISSIALRYFNAAGCDLDGEIGEDHDPETHAIPLAIAAALNGGDFTVNGTDFPTRDGSAVRDYIHVSDLASAHVLAGERLYSGAASGADRFNLGTGRGASVLEVADAIAARTGRPLTRQSGPRRPGDPAELVADARRANEVLGWVPVHSTLDIIVSSALAWQRSGPASLSPPSS